MQAKSFMTRSQLRERSRLTLVRCPEMEPTLRRRPDESIGGRSDLANLAKERPEMAVLSRHCNECFGDQIERLGTVHLVEHLVQKARKLVVVGLRHRAGDPLALRRIGQRIVTADDPRAG